MNLIKQKEAMEALVQQENNVPLWFKYALTIDEASKYFNIGRNKLRFLTYANNSDYILRNGTKVLIKREKFERYLNGIKDI